MKLPVYAYFVLAIFGLFVGFVQYQSWAISGPVTVNYFLNFLPPMLVLIAYTARHKIDEACREHNGSSCCAINGVTCLIALLFWGVCTLVSSQMTEVTDVRQYDRILGSKNTPAFGLLTTHFPRPIPEDAQDVRFSSRMFRSPHFQLRYSTSPENIAELYDRFSEQKTMSFFGGETNDHMNVENGMPTTFFFTGDLGYDREAFPDDYEIMIFDELVSDEEKAADRTHSNHESDHGSSHGVAISRQRNEIVYWAYSW